MQRVERQASCVTQHDAAPLNGWLLHAAGQGMSQTSRRMEESVKGLKNEK